MVPAAESLCNSHKSEKPARKLQGQFSSTLPCELPWKPVVNPLLGERMPIVPQHRGFGQERSVIHSAPQRHPAAQGISSESFNLFQSITPLLKEASSAAITIPAWHSLVFNRQSPSVLALNNKIGDNRTSSYNQF